MHFIQNHELREWVKEGLRKAIFQKAHALAIQTGCEILVKLQDDSDTTASHQYYATKVLRQAYNNNRLRIHPEEKIVSGETGMPVVNRGMQMGEGFSEEEYIRGMIESEYQEQYLANGDAITQTAMHEQMSGKTVFVQSDETNTVNSQMDRCPSTISPANDELPEVRIKVERLDGDMEVAMSSCDATSQGLHRHRHSESLPASTSTLPRSIVSINPKPYQCAVCRKAFRSVQVLLKHTQTFHARLHSVRSSQIRSRGGRLSSSRLPSQEHLQDLGMPPGHPEFKGFYCVMCNQDFQDSATLQDHMSLSHMETVHGHHVSSLDNSSENHHQSLAGSISSAASETVGTMTSTNPTNKVLFAVPGLPGSQGHSQSPSSSVPMFMKLPSSPNAPFSQSSLSGPIFSHHPGFPVGPSRMSGSSGRSKHRTYTKRLMGKQLSNRDIMSAILQTAGPVATHFTVLTASPNFILGSTYITKEQFVGAASALQDLHLGSLVTVRHVHGRPSVNFVKKPPEDAKEFLQLEANVDLCTPQLYDEKFKAATPACVPQGTRDKLISLGLVTQDDFK